MAPRSRAICWIPIWDEQRQGTGLEHLLLREGSADGLLLTFDEHGVVLDYEGMFRRVG